MPVLILGNKIDRPEAISEEQLRVMFGLHGQTTGKVRNICHDGNSSLAFALLWFLQEVSDVYFSLVYLFQDA